MDLYTPSFTINGSDFVFNSVRGVDAKFIITGELAYLIPIKITTMGTDIILKNLNTSNTPLEKISRISTEGAPTMSGRNIGIPSLKFIANCCPIKSYIMHLWPIGVSQLLS